MIMMLDVSRKKHAQLQKKVIGRGLTIGQLRTPLTRYRTIKDTPLGIDNGCFSGKLDKKTWERIVKENTGNKNLKFVAMPDVVGDARRTLELFDIFSPRFEKVPVALVIQDGMEDLPMPWQWIDAIFVGGTNAFKDSIQSMAIAKAAKILGKWIHVGRVNTPDRIRHWMNIADSCDGSGLAKYDHMFSSAASVLSGHELPKCQSDLFDEIDEEAIDDLDSI